jgi:hypothetical protein
MGLIFIEIYLGFICIWKMRLHYAQANGILTVSTKAV